MERKAEARKAGALAAPKAHTAHGTRHTAHSRPDRLPQGMAHCPLQGPASLVPLSGLRRWDSPVSKETRAY